MESILTQSLFIDFCHHINQMQFAQPIEAYKFIKEYFHRFGFDVQYHSEVYSDDVDDEGLLQYDYLYVRPIDQPHLAYVYQFMQVSDNGQVQFSFRPYLGNEEVICCS